MHGTFRSIPTAAYIRPPQAKFYPSRDLSARHRPVNQAMGPNKACDHVVADTPFWENPGATAINRRGSHAPLRSFPSAAAALQYFTAPVPASDADLWGPCPRVTRLSGCKWDCRVFERPSDVPAGFWEPGYGAKGFGKVRGAELALRTRMAPPRRHSLLAPVVHPGSTSPPQPCVTHSHTARCPSPARSLSPATGSVRARGCPSTATMSTRCPWTRRQRRQTTPRASTATASRRRSSWRGTGARMQRAALRPRRGGAGLARRTV